MVFVEVSQTLHNIHYQTIPDPHPIPQCHNRPLLGWRPLRLVPLSPLTYPISQGFHFSKSFMMMFHVKRLKMRRGLAQCFWNLSHELSSCFPLSFR